jgi:putative restriction endonuclease
MRTVVLGPRSPELDALIARRRSLGLDTHDEVWKGDYHMAPAAHSSHGWLDKQLAELLGPTARAAGLGGTGPFNLGEPDDFRVPDRGLHRKLPHAVWVSTAAVVVEIESPDDETWDKLDFYVDHDVDELLIVSAESCSVSWLVLKDGRYEPLDESRLLGPDSRTLADRIEWLTES